MKSWMITSEEFFLKLFKGALLITMGLALVGALLFVGLGLRNLTDTPKEPAPAKEPPAAEVSASKFLGALTEHARKKEAAAQPKSTEKPDPNAVLRPYQEPGKRLAACSREFSQAINPEHPLSDADEATQAEVLTGLLQSVERHSSLGTDWAPAAVSFACATLKDPQVIEFRKKNADYNILMPALEFHRNEWQANRRAAADFREREATRVNQERHEEELRVMAEKQQAWILLGTAGSLLLVFALLAFYLIFAKIETNLRRLAEASDRGH